MELKVLDVSKTEKGRKTAVINLLTVLCLNVSFWLTFMSLLGMKLGIVPIVLAVVTQGIIFFVSRNKTFGKFTLFYALMLTALCLLIGYSFFGKAFMFIANFVADALNSENGLVMVPFNAEIPSGKESLYLYAGLTLLMFLTSALFVSSAAWLGVVFILFGLLFGLTANTWAFCFFILSLCLWIMVWGTRNANALSRTHFLFVEIISILLVFLLILGFILSSFTSWSLMTRIHNSVNNKVETARFAGDDTSEVAFYITSNEDPKGLYFRTSTEVLDKKAYTGEYLGLLQYLAKDNYYPCAQLYPFYEKDIERTGSGTKLLNITIENVSLSSKTLLVPYEVVIDDAFKKNSFSENFIVAKGIKGQRNYSYNAYKGTFVDYADSDLEKWAVVDENESEMLYRKFVYDKYLSVPKDFDSSPYSEFSGKRYKDVVFQVRKMFDEGTYEDGFDYCTEAVNAFRFCGVPARLAKGYYISDAVYDYDEVFDRDNIKYAIFTEAYHSWVEIFVDTIGWIPVEVVPGFYDLYEEESEKKTMITDRTKIQEKNIYHDNVESGNDSSEYGENDRTNTIILLGIIFVVIAVCITVLVILNRHMLLKTIKKADSEKSTFVGYKYLLKRLMRKKYVFDSDNLYSLNFGKEFDDYLNLVYEERYSLNGLTEEKRKQVSEYVLRLVKTI
ncbi:MAG: hypothetical protein IJR10_01605 [Clostridia bacterium]|nr:hypothetical protein [Clostridia bacterium]